MLKLKYLPPEIRAREFCQAWFGLQNLSSEDLHEQETETGYRASCVKVLAKVLGVSTRTVRSWGRGLEFENMPTPYRKSLSYALTLAKSTSKKVA